MPPRANPSPEFVCSRVWRPFRAYIVMALFPGRCPGLDYPRLSGGHNGCDQDDRSHPQRNANIGLVNEVTTVYTPARVVTHGNQRTALRSVDTFVN
jgi:hypothetical protein